MNLDPYKNLLNLKHHKSHYSVSIYKDTDQDFLFFYGYIHQATGNWGLKGQIGVSGGQKLKGEGAKTQKLFMVLIEVFINLKFRK